MAFGPTAEVLTPERLARARRLSEAFDEHAPECHIELPEDTPSWPPPLTRITPLPARLTGTEPASPHTAVHPSCPQRDRVPDLPFTEFAFMRRALAGCLALALGATPVGVFLLLRRMSLMGDAMSHAILPGAALGYLAFGLSLGAMTIGGIVAGLVVVFAAGW